MTPDAPRVGSPHCTTCEALKLFAERINDPQTKEAVKSGRKKVSREIIIAVGCPNLPTGRNGRADEHFVHQFPDAFGTAHGGRWADEPLRENEFANLEQVGRILKAG